MTSRDPHDDLAEELFAAARREQPDEQARTRTKQLALRARAGINAVRERDERNPLPYWPVLGAALAVAVIAVLVASALRAPEPVSPVVITPEVLERAPRTDAPRAPRAPAAERAQQAQPKLVPSPALAPHDRARSTSKLTPRPQPSLAEEIALLEQARAALAASESARVIALVDRYEGALGGTRMRAEAALLRIEALAQSGQHERAAKLAQRFIEDHAGSPLADRARALSKIADHPEANQ